MHMRPLLRRLTWGLGGLAAFALLIATGAFAASEAMIRWPHHDEAPALVASRGADAIVRGKRLATIMGCHDCHGADLTGRLFFDQMPVGRVAGPNLSLVLPHQTDGEIARAIRQGIAADGRPLWIMPSDAFSRLSDRETADLIAYLRTFPAKGLVQPAKQIGPVGRIGVLLGRFKSEPQMLADQRGLEPVDLGAQYAHGRELARACMECHGPELKGGDLAHAPDLAIAGAYELADFERLLRTGIAAGDRKVGLMSESAPGRFNAFTHDEIAALHAYLKARAERSS
jgi:mono/diheme cytochrome c family protein